MDVKKPIYCALAFGSASINSHGEYIPCCNIRSDYWRRYQGKGMPNDDPYIKINTPNLRQLRKELISGTWPNACLNCKEAEEAGADSMRTIWNSSFQEKFKDGVPMIEQVSNRNIHYLDLTFSTKCNSKCMTCGPYLSDFWEEENEVIWQLKGEKRTYRRICIDDTTAEKIVRDFPNVEIISFIGGEPTISEEHIKFLNLLVSTGRSKNIRLNYVTNLTGFNDELTLLWENFKNVGLSVSIDGYGKVNEYIRYPFKWSKTETNLRMFLELCKKNPNKFGIGLSCTLSVFNAIQSMDLFEFWFDTLIEYKIDKTTLAHVVGCFVNRVTFPNYTRIGLLSKEYRKAGIEKGHRLLEKINNYIEQNPNSVNKGITDSIKLTMLWLEDEEITDPKIHANNHNLITASDKFRNRNLKDYIPELHDELEKVWNMYVEGSTKL